MKKTLLFVIFFTFLKLTAQCPPGADPNNCNPGATCADACQNAYNEQVTAADNEYETDMREAGEFLEDAGFWEDMVGAYDKGNVWEGAKASKEMSDALDAIDRAGKEYENHLGAANDFREACLGNC
jgi:hypothetical protein